MLTLYEIFQQISKTKNRVEASEILKRYESPELLFVLRYMFDETFPKPTKLKPRAYKRLNIPFGSGHSYLKHNMNRLNLCLETSKIPNEKKLNMLMGILGGLHEEDAKIVEKMFKHNKLKFKRVTEAAVRRAFPDLLMDKPEKK